MTDSFASKWREWEEIQKERRRKLEEAETVRKLKQEQAKKAHRAAVAIWLEAWDEAGDDPSLLEQILEVTPANMRVNPELYRDLPLWPKGFRDWYTFWGYVRGLEPPLGAMFSEKVRKKRVMRAERNGVTPHKPRDRGRRIPPKPGCA